MRYLALLTLVAACGSTPNRPLQQAAVAESQALEELAPGPSGEPLVAHVGGQSITAKELFGAWLHRESRQVRGYLEELVLSRMVMFEALRLGVDLPQTALDEALNEASNRLQDQVQQVSEDIPVREFIARRLGLDPDSYLAYMREQTAIDLYASRVVRAWLMATQRVEVRVILTDAEDDAEAARAALDAGEDFAAVCARHSVDPSAAQAGRVPPVVSGPTAMARLAFSTPVGGVGGPVEEGGRWLLLKVDSRPSPTSGAWEEIGPLVEASLAERAIEDPEYWQWKTWLFEQYEVDMSPLLEFAAGALVD